MRINARWTNDCGGKKDFDGPLVRVSTRYWPADGGFYISDALGDFRKNDVLGKPSAHCTIDLLAFGGEAESHEDIEPEYETIATKECEGDTYEDVQRQVETWAQAQMERIERALRAEFATPAQPKE